MLANHGRGAALVRKNYGITDKFKFGNICGAAKNLRTTRDNVGRIFLMIDQKTEEILYASASEDVLWFQPIKQRAWVVAVKTYASKRLKTGDHAFVLTQSETNVAGISYAVDASEMGIDWCPTEAGKFLEVL
jgi:hypothetical protein